MKKRVAVVVETGWRGGDWGLVGGRMDLYLPEEGVHQTDPVRSASTFRSTGHAYGAGQ